MLDLIIKNVSVVDGSGGRAYTGSVGIRNGRIVLEPAGDAAEIIDAGGLTLCPGFIDSHSHTDRYIGVAPELISTCKISQGITTEVVGQCGSSTFPVPADKREAMRQFFTEGMDDEQLERILSFRDFKAYVEFVKKQNKVGNYAFLSGHGALRLAAMGFENRRPADRELDVMKQYLAAAMENGCFGLSSGLIYVPGAYADTQELIELCRVIKPYGGIYATHMRSESEHVTEAVEEAIRIAKTAEVPLFISHHKVVGARNWGSSARTLKLVHEAIEEGVKITLDLYPYIASQTGLCQCIPPKYFSKGIKSAVELLKDPLMRSTIRQEIEEDPPKYNNSYQNAGGFSGILILNSPKVPEAAGMTVEAYAQKTGRDPFDAYFDLMLENEGVGSGAYFCIDGKELEAIYMDENTVVGTDGMVGSKDGPVHPRAYGSMVRALCCFSKQKGLLSFEEAVRKQTHLTAERWGIPNKGLIAEGYDADLVLLDYDKLSDKADFNHPRELCDGIEAVFVNGKTVYKNKMLTGSYPGEVLLRK